MPCIGNKARCNSWANDNISLEGRWLVFFKMNTPTGVWDKIGLLFIEYGIIPFVLKIPIGCYSSFYISYMLALLKVIIEVILFRSTMAAPRHLQRSRVAYTILR